MDDWLGVCTIGDVMPFVEALRKMAEQYYPNKNDVCKDAVIILGTSITYSKVPNKCSPLPPRLLNFGFSSLAPKKN